MACKECGKPAPEVRGSVWAGEPAGKEVKLHGMDVYVAAPTSPTSQAVLMIPEVNGAAAALSHSGRSADSSTARQT